MNGMETKKPEEIGYYDFQPPHWDQPRPCEVVEKDGKLYVQYLDGKYPTLLEEVPVGSLWRPTAE